MIYRGNAFGKLKQYNKALEAYDRAIAIDSQNAFAWFNRGLALSRLGRYDEAIDSYDKGLAIDPDNTQAIRQRQQTLKLKGRKYKRSVISSTY